MAGCFSCNTNVCLTMIKPQNSSFKLARLPQSKMAEGIFYHWRMMLAFTACFLGCCSCTSTRKTADPVHPPVEKKGMALKAKVAGHSSFPENASIPSVNPLAGTSGNALLLKQRWEKDQAGIFENNRVLPVTFEDATPTKQGQDVFFDDHSLELQRELKDQRASWGSWESLP